MNCGGYVSPIMQHYNPKNAKENPRQQHFEKWQSFIDFAGVRKNQAALNLRILLWKKCPKFFDSVIDIKSSPSFDCKEKANTCI